MTGRILGGRRGGRLGDALIDAFANCEVIAHTRSTLDITDPESVRRVVGGAVPHVRRRSRSSHFTTASTTTSPFREAGGSTGEVCPLVRSSP